MGTTRAGGYYLNASGTPVDAEGKPIAANAAANAVADAADEPETEAPAEAKPAAKPRGKKK